jgi:hypothetical protein
MHIWESDFPLRKYNLACLSLSKFIMRNISQFSLLAQSTSVTKRLVFITAMTGFIGCTADAPKAPDYYATNLQAQDFAISRVALVTNLTPPEIESVDLGLTHGEGAAGGAAAGAVGAPLRVAAGFLSADPFAAAVFLLLYPPILLGAAVVGAVGGAVVGASSGHSAEELAEAEANARRMLDSAYLQTSLLEHAQRYASDNVDLDFIRTPNADPETRADRPDYEALSREMIDAVLEVDLLRLSLEGSLQIKARGRLISAQSGEVAVIRDAFIGFQRHLYGA